MPFTRRQFFTNIMGEMGLQTAPTHSRGQAPSDPIQHLLNRISWGARPEEIARARQMGIEAYLDEQLDPASIGDAECEAKLRQFPILNMDRRAIYSLADDEYRSYRALIQGMLTRATHSKRQLLERVVEFWSDHFNVYAEDEAPDNVVYQREAIRKHALGNFRDMLIATAKSPAMLVYLDNFINVAEAPNENYARELLELHTLGVDGGYTEADVKEVARAFTGWTVHNGTPSGFYFDPNEHDTSAKTILGHRLPLGRGIEDGLHVLSIVANHPATARFISRKLCVRFVADNPPDSLVDSVTQVWQQTDGNITAILRHLFLSDEFLASAGQKLRRPLDFFVGALRATGTSINNWWQLEEMLQSLGQPPYGWHPPNGYPDVAGAWMATGGLLARWNIAMRLTHGAYADPYGLGDGLQTTLRQSIGNPTTVGELVDEVAAQVFGVLLSGSDRDYFIAYVANGGGAETAVSTRLSGRKLATLFGLMLASPQYQWR